MKPSRLRCLIPGLILLFSITSYENTVQPEENKNNNSSEIVFQFIRPSTGYVFNNDYLVWHFSYFVSINQKYYALSSGDIKFEKNYKITVPPGRLSIRYSLTTGTNGGILFYTGRKNESKCYNDGDEIERELTVMIKNNQTVYLKMIDVGSEKLICSWGQSGCLGRFPFPGRGCQEVAFEVEKVEDIKK
jgi:hypothetical protein